MARKRPHCKSQVDARARALIELQMLLNFWGAALDGKPESYMAGVCYEVAMGDVDLDQGPMKIIMSYLHKEGGPRELDASSSCRPCELWPV